jgi:hypothetical protein
MLKQYLSVILKILRKITKKNWTADHLPKKNKKNQGRSAKHHSTLQLIKNARAIIKPLTHKLQQENQEFTKNNMG